MRRALSSMILLALLAAPTAAEAGSYVGDTTSAWAHVGGGLGVMDMALITTGGVEAGYVPQARICLGGGGYTIGLFGGGGLDLTLTEALPFRIDAYGVIGVHIPIPVVHPLIGLKAGIGIGAVPGLPPMPSITLGGHAGVIIRKFDKKMGIRLNLEPAAVIVVDPDAGALAGGELLFTVAFVS